MRSPTVKINPDWCMTGWFDQESGLFWVAGSSELEETDLRLAQTLAEYAFGRARPDPGTSMVVMTTRMRQYRLASGHTYAEAIQALFGQWDPDDRHMLDPHRPGLDEIVDAEMILCCDLHQDEGCCDTDDCGPCCENCPTCPTLARQRAQRRQPVLMDEDDEYVELTGDDLPYHLRADAPPTHVCDTCARQTWQVDEPDDFSCQFPQPDSSSCPGVMVRNI